MRLKSFYAKTMTEAMQMVRDTLGEDAVIVATREERGGKAVHVTAAIEPAFELGQGGSAAGADDWLQYDDEENESPITEELTDTLLRHGVPEEIMDHILSCATVVGMNNPESALTAAIEHLFLFRPLPQKVTNKPIMMVGPPGSGKTLAVAKAATRATMNSLRVGVISCDTVRAGGIEQLKAFTNLLRVNLAKANSPQDLKSIIADMRGYDQIIIDTPGINPFDKESLKVIAKLIGSTQTDPYLVLPAGLDADESGEIARIFSAVGITNLLPTRIDIARRMGGLLCAAHQGNLAFTDAGNTPKVADGLISLSPRSLTGILMPTIGETTGSKRTGTGH